MPTIRPYRPQDRDRLLEIWHQASRIGHPFLNEGELEEQKILVRDIYLPKAETWVALDGDNPVGFIGLLDSFIGGLFVHPEAHQKGYGVALVRHAAALKGDLEVEVYSLNEGALRFYGRAGFSEISRRPTDDQGRELELVRLGRFMRTS